MQPITFFSFLKRGKEREREREREREEEEEGRSWEEACLTATGYTSNAQ